VKSAELETEKGRLVYSFDIITSDKKIMEVQIDAQTGEVVVVEEESEEHERQEEQHKRKRAKQGDAAQRP
jgi:regulator of RNase E activity RraB